MTTRYPKRGKGHKWTIKELEAVTADWAGDILSDGEGLQGEVRAAGDRVSIVWRYAYKWEGKTKRFYCGAWPAVTLEKVREARDSARDTVKAGVNPVDQKQAVRIEAQRAVEATIADDQRQRSEDLTVLEMYQAWIKDGVNRSDGNAELRRIFEKDVLPQAAAIKVREFTEHDLRGIVRHVVGRDANRLGVVVFNGIKQMLAWAEKRKPWRALLIEGNPAELVDIEKLVDPDYDLENVRERVLPPAEIRELAAKCAALRENYAKMPAGKKYSGVRPLKEETELAAWICLSTLSRIGETVAAAWDNIDWTARTWYIPAEDVKRTRAGRRAQLVHLSDFSYRQFQRLHVLTGHTPWCFPSKLDPTKHIAGSSPGKQVGDRQEMFMDREKPLKNRRTDNELVLAGGKSGNWTMHDMRRTGATIMENLGIEDKIIDLCQNHVIHTGKNKVRRHYLHGDNTERKRQAWAALGDYLDALLTADNVVPIGKRA